MASMRPQRLKTFWNTAAESSYFETSAEKNSAFAVFRSDRSCVPADWRRPVQATFQPLVQRRLASSDPMPD
jgi:hypothetical protein